MPEVPDRPKFYHPNGLASRPDGSRALLRQPRGPVEDHDQGPFGGQDLGNDREERLAVRRDVELRPSSCRRHRSLRDRLAKLQRRSGPHRNRHQLPIGREKEELAAAAPPRRAAAAGRDARGAAFRPERRDINFGRARLVDMKATNRPSGEKRALC